MTELRRDSGAPLAVLAALAAEVAPLRRRARATLACSGGSLEVSAGELGGHPVLLAVTGDGPRRACRGLEELLARRPAAVLVVGVAGALSPELEVGQLVVARSVGTEAGFRPTRDSPWRRRAIEHPRTLPGRVLSVGRILATRAAKAACSAGAGTEEPTVVDLESAILVNELERHDVPYVVVRAVSDTAVEDLPVDFERFRGADGALRPFAVLGHALVRPRLLPELWRLRARVRQCAEHLAEVVEELVVH